MWEVFVWVPTKGWKSVLRCRKAEAAVEKAREMEPLEVKVVAPYGRSYHCGKVVMVDHSSTPCADTLIGLEESLGLVVPGIEA